jgi:hypothetical protein
MSASKSDDVKSLKKALAQLQLGDGWALLGQPNAKTEEKKDDEKSVDGKSELPGTPSGGLAALLSEGKTPSDLDTGLVGRIFEMVKLQRPKGKRGRGLKSPIAVYPFVISILYSKTASGGGVSATSVPLAKPADWPSISTWQLIFQKYRVVAYEVGYTPGVADNGSATTPHTLCAYFDTSATTVTPGGFAGQWSAPGSKLLLLSAGFGANNYALKPLLKGKVLPEQEWFDLGSSAQQKGCFAHYADGFTPTTGTLSVWVRIKVEFCGLLL